MMSKSPTTASRLAAAVAAMPWSCIAGTKWVLMIPLVVQPQTKNVPASSQKARVRPASARVVRAVLAAAQPLWVALRSCSASVRSPLAPYGRSPTSAGRSAITHHTRGMRAAQATAIAAEAVRQPLCSMVLAMTGRNTSWPVAQAAPRTPRTRPRRLTNQRLVTSAPKTSAVEPVPRPTRTPQSTTSCQESVITSVRPVPAQMSRSASAAMRRIPKRSISAAAKGAVSP